MNDETETHFLGANIRYDLRKITNQTLWPKQYAITRLKRIKMNKIGKARQFITKIKPIMRRSTLSENEVIEIAKNNLPPTLKIYLCAITNESCINDFQTFSNNVLICDDRLKQPYDWDKIKKYLKAEFKIYCFQLIQDYALLKSPYYLDTEEFREQIRQFPQCPLEKQNYESTLPMFHQLKVELGWIQDC